MREKDDQSALIERIVASEAFATAPDQIEFLKFLFRNRQRRMQAKHIEEERYGRPIGSYGHNAGHARERIADLRKRLELYFKQVPEKKWKCGLSLKGDGYQLEFEDIGRPSDATEIIWKPHLERADDVIVICGSHVFFFDPAVNSALRYYDFNDERDNPEELLEKFRAAHPEAYKPTLEPLHHSYLSTGEVNAFESIQRFFHGRSGILLKRTISRDIAASKVHRSCPILLGRPVTNKYIHRIMNSEHGALFGYRIGETLGSIRISNLVEQEKERLADYPLNKDGLLGPVKNWKSVFGLVTRMPNPSGYGHVTIISADFYARVISQIAETLTDERLARTILEEANWPIHADLPDVFEMLFVVGLSPGGLEGEGHPKLLCWRKYQDGT